MKKVSQNNTRKTFVNQQDEEMTKDPYSTLFEPSVTCKREGVKDYFDVIKCTYTES
jgi:hypothetical protein